MLEFLLVLLGIGSLFLWVQKLYPDDGIKCMVWSTAIFFACYTIVSACLFWIDAFNICRVLIIIDGTAVFSVLLGVIQKKCLISLPRMPWKEYGLSLVVILCMLPFVCKSFGFYGMAQDQGVYQTHAIYLMSGLTDVQNDIEEYNLLTDPEEQENFVRVVQDQLVGYYTGEEFGSYPTYGAEEYDSPVAGIFHGIPNFAALLALSGRMFGLSHMMGLQLLFWACAVLLVHMTGKNLNWKPMTNLMAVVILAVCPEVIWIVKSALTEPFLMFIMAAWAYFMTEGRKHSVWGAAAAMVTFSFFHISAFIYVIMAYIIFVVYYFRTGKTDSVWACGSMVAGLCAGFTMMACVSPRYTYMNMSFSLYKLLPFMKDSYCLPFIWMVGLLGICFLIFILRWNHGQKLTAFFDGIWAVRLFRLFVMGMLFFQLFLYARQVNEIKSFRLAFQQMSISAFAYMTGCLIIPATIVLLLKNGRALLEDVRGMILCGAFIYCVLFYVSFLRPTTSYYYYARYLAPYIPLVVLCAGLCMDRWNSHVKGVILAVSVLMVMPSDMVLQRQEDDTLIEWDILEELADNISCEDVLIMEEDDFRRLYLPVRAMTGAKVYLKYGELTDQLDRVDDEKGLSYYLANGSSMIDPHLGEIVWEDRYKESEDLGDKGGRWIPFPTEFTVVERSLALYLCDRDYRTNYTMSQKDFCIDGFDRLEADFRWTVQEQVNVEVCLEPADYMMTIRCMMGIPKQVLENNKPYDIKVFLEDNKVGEIHVTDSSQTEFSLRIPAELLQEEKMILSMEIPLWNASLVTEGDDRELGLPVQAIDFDRIISQAEE